MDSFPTESGSENAATEIVYLMPFLHPKEGLFLWGGCPRVPFGTFALRRVGHREMEIHHNTIDQHNRPASFGFENNFPWIEFCDSPCGRTVIVGYTAELRERIRQEIVLRGIQIPFSEHPWFREEPHKEIPPIALPDAHESPFTEPLWEDDEIDQPISEPAPPTGSSQKRIPPTAPSPMKKSTILSRGQEEILKTLIPYAALATNGLVDKFPIVPRTATLIAGPSGVGKSRIVEELAARLKLPLWTANVSGWQVQGARGDAPTLHNLFEWVQDRPRGIIFLDEAEKAYGASDWFSSVRLELHDVLDARLPRNFKTPYMTMETLFDYPEECKIVIDEADRVMSTNERLKKEEQWRKDLERKLKTRFFIVAAGAWQTEWEQSSASIGFGQSTGSRQKTIDRKSLLKSIAPEILNRFRSEIAFLDPMEEDDYINFAATLMEKMPGDLQPWFANLSLGEIENALTHNLGMRIFEELAAKAWVARFMFNVENNNAPSQATKNWI
ncbi:MAG: AAA family ATPase [Luteolibacter sp.]